MTESYLLSGCRTPIGKFLGRFSSVPATDLGASVVREAIARADIEAAAVDEVIMGNVLSAGLGQAPARQAQSLPAQPSTNHVHQRRHRQLRKLAQRGHQDHARLGGVQAAHQRSTNAPPTKRPGLPASTEVA